MKRIFVSVAGIVFAVTFLATGNSGLLAMPFDSATPSPSVEKQNPGELTPEQAQLVEEKAQAAETAGIVSNDETKPSELTFPQPVQTGVQNVRLTREDIQVAFENSLAAMQEQLKEVEDRDGPDAARAMEEGLRQQMLETQAKIPPEGMDVEVPMAHLGTGSIQLSQYTYGDGSPTDPMNVIFVGPAGSDWDVNYDLKNWTTVRWHNDSDGGAGIACQSKQQYYVWDAVHGGTDSWRDNSYGLQPSWDSCSPIWNPQARFHLRVFPGGYDNHAGGFQEYSFGAAHNESTGHNIRSWEAAESLVQLSFRDPSTGNPLWFVGSIYWQQIFTSQTWRGFMNDGKIPIIVLNS